MLPKPFAHHLMSLSGLAGESTEDALLVTVMVLVFAEHIQAIASGQDANQVQHWNCRHCSGPATLPRPGFCVLPLDWQTLGPNPAFCSSWQACKF